jgi:hypothetical protein
MNRNSWAGIAATAAVVIVVILGFRVLGSPTTQRLVQSDVRTIRSLTELARQINQTWANSGKILPDNLEKFPKSVKQDPIGAKSFSYHPKSNNDYGLCATFATDNRDMQANSPSDRWIHPKGEYCFEFEASERVPFVPYEY